GLVREATVVVVDPVPREPTGTRERALDRPICVDCERQSRPHERGLPLDERAAANTARGRHTRTATRGLYEPDPTIALHRLRGDVGQPDRLECARHRTELDRGADHE